MTAQPAPIPAPSWATDEPFIASVRAGFVTVDPEFGGHTTSNEPEEGPQCLT